MSMFNVRKGGKKSFRKKVVVTDEEDDEEKQTATPAEVISSAPVRSVGTKGSSLSSKSSSVSKAGGILSFISDEGEEEEKDVFKIKKKKDHSRRLAKMMAREKKKEQKMLNSASTISKLKNEESKTRIREVSDEEDGSNADSESSERILAGDDALEDQSQSQGFPNVRIGPGGIPDSSTVHAIRKHRELMRQIGQNVAPSIVKQPSSKGRDYIPLDKSARRNDSRLVREDDNDRSDNEDDGKEIVMSFGTGNKPTTQQQVITALEDVGSEEDDEETRRWEEEQISKGVKIIQSGTLQQDVDPYQFYSGNTQAAFVYRTGQAQYPQQLQSQSWMSGVPGDSLSRLPHKLAPVTLGSLKQRLLNQLTELKEVNSNHQQSLSSANEDLTTFTTDIEQFEEQTTTLACDYQFYQETRAYLRNLLGCLGEKNTEICALEEKVFGVWSGRTERLISRRHQDVLDLMEECSRIDGVAKQNTSVELDEFGRDKNQLKEEARKRRMANCAGRKRRRKEKKDKSLGTSPEGLSTDDEEIESDLQRMALEIGNIKKEVDELFDDVVEDFCSLPVIMKHFEEWKFSRDKTYTEAFIPLSAQKVFVPFVRREMVFWNPLESQCKEIEDYEWFRTLLFYGHVWESTPLESDEDNLLLPNLVESVILTKMTGLVEKVWDPLSSAQTKRLVSCIEGLQREFPTISPLSKPLQGLYQAILLRLRRCLDADVYIPLYSKQQLENPSSLHHQFYQGQFWKAVKLFGNICLWATALSGGIRQIRELAVDGLLNRYLIMALQNMPPLFANVEKLSKLIGLIPRDWLEEELGVQFSSLTRCAIHLADGLYQSTIGHPDHERRKVKSSVQTLSKLLKTLRAEEEVEKLLSAYSI